MWAVTKNGWLVARDFRTKPEALAWAKMYDKPMRVINQNSKEFLQIEEKTRKALR